MLKTPFKTPSMSMSISIIESIYILYMFSYFKTKTYIPHPLDYITSSTKLTKHNTTKNYESKICPLGNIIGYILPIWFIVRHSIENYKKINTIIIGLLFIGCLISNMNAFVYAIPIFIIEYSTNNLTLKL